MQFSLRFQANLLLRFDSPLNWRNVMCSGCYLSSRVSLWTPLKTLLHRSGATTLILITLLLLYIICSHAARHWAVCGRKVDMGSSACAITCVHVVRMKHEGETGTDELAQVLTQRIWRMSLHSVTSSSWTLATGLDSLTHQPLAPKLPDSASLKSRGENKERSDSWKWTGLVD